MDSYDSAGAAMTIADVSSEPIITIRCLTAVPDDMEQLLAELAAAESALDVE